MATNAAGSARQDSRLSINMRPAFKELPGDVTLNKGQSLALSCHAQGTPSPVISWNVNNSPRQGAPPDVVLWLSYSQSRCCNISFFPGAAVDEAGRSSLIIENVTTSDAGTYVCVAENSVGSVRTLSFVRVRGNLDNRAFSGAFLQVL